MVFQCDCCHYSTPFRYTYKQHILTKKHQLKIKEVPVEDEVSKLKLKIEEQEKLIEVQQSLLDNQTSQIDHMISRIQEIGPMMGSNMGNTTNNNVQNIHILLHPDMHMTQLTKYDYQVILKKIQDREFEKIEEVDE